MNKSCKKSIALLLVILQLVVLLPVTAVQTKAVDPEPAATETTAPQPVLNKVIRGTVQFGTFNFTGAVGSREAADYVMPFLYTDDYFATSAIQPNVTGKEMSWKALENKSLATTSLDFTMACFGSNEEITSEADYDTEYDKNGRAFLEACDFKYVESNNYTYDGSNLLTKENQYNKFPSKDSIGVIVGSKDITVWDAEAHDNLSYKLIAVGVRGAGYGAEWASNFTLGASGEHQGFREAADKVEYKLEDYLEQRGITATDNVKFWVCGYSRAGAVANLVAGDLTSKYSVDKANVYGYTFESAAGADASIDADGRTYPNIHNILSKLDAVPRVSSTLFGNNRYGVDYIVPYYGNTQDADGLNEAYYNRMYSILPTVAQGYYDADGNVKADPVLTDAMPKTASGGNYPVDGEIMVHSFEFGSVLGDSKGVVEYTGPWDSQPDGHDIGVKRNNRYYLKVDEFLDKFVNILLSSYAWDYDPDEAHVAVGSTGGLFSKTIYNNRPLNPGTPMDHRVKFATKQGSLPESYQDALRDLIGIALGTPGAKLTDAFGDIGAIVRKGWSKLAQTLGAITGPFGNGYDDIPDEERADEVARKLAGALKDVLLNTEPFSTNTTATEKAINTLSPVLARLFLYDRNDYSSQYFGTLLKYAIHTILVTHTPELDVSWQMAMDENYTSSYRTILLPNNAEVKAYVFRPGVDDALPQSDLAAAAAANGAEVASITGGNLTTSDQRFELLPDAPAGMIKLRYPGTMDLRFDITGSTAGLQVTDLQPDQKQVNIMATYGRDDSTGNINPASKDVTYNGMLTDRPGASAQALNGRNDLAIAEGETLHVMAWHGSNSLDQPQMQATENTYDAVKTVTVKWLESDGETVLDETQVVSGAVPVPPADPEKAPDAQYTYTFLGWLDEDGELVDDFAPVTGSVTYTAVFTAVPKTYTVVWKNWNGDVLETDENVPYGDMPEYNGEEPSKPDDAQTISHFIGWDPAVAPVTGNVEYTAQFESISRKAVTFYADDVQNKNGSEPIKLEGGMTDGAGVVQQPNYPSYMGYTLTGATVVSGGVTTEVAAVDNAIPTEAINEAIHGNSATVTVHYAQDQTNTYQVKVIYALADGTEISSYVTNAFAVGDAVQITASEEKSYHGTTYYFNHWEVEGGGRYDTRVITLRPNEGNGRIYTIRAIMSEQKPAEEQATVAILNTYAETQAGKNKIAVTMTWSAPGVEAIEYAGFCVSWDDGTTTVVNNKYSRLTTPTGTYTLHINRTGSEAQPITIYAILAYRDANQQLQTRQTDPIHCSWNTLAGIE